MKKISIDPLTTRKLSNFIRSVSPSIPQTSDIIKKSGLLFHKVLESLYKNGFGK